MKSYNKVTLKGRLNSYELSVYNGDKGDAIRGRVGIEVDKDGTVVNVEVFAYPTYSSGKRNRSYGFLEEMLNGEMVTVENLRENPDLTPAWLAIDGNIDISYFVGKEGAKSADDVMRSQKIRGSFINPNNKHEYFNEWAVDMLVTATHEYDADAERNTPNYLTFSGYFVDTFRNSLLGVSFDARDTGAPSDSGAMNFIRSLDGNVSESMPFFSQVRGDFRTVKTIKVAEGFFGEDRTTENNSVYWVVNWISKNVYTFGEDIEIDKYNDFKAELEDIKQKAFEKWKDSEDDPSGDNLVF